MTPEYMALRQRLMQQWGLGGGEQVSGPAMSGSTQADRFQQMAGRGTAPLTLGNIAAAGSNAFNLMGGMGALTTGAASIGELGASAAPGSWGGIQNMRGYRAIPPERRRVIQNLADYEHARQDAQANKALDSHGQVRGGGTGSAGGGLTQGGPR